MSFRFRPNAAVVASLVLVAACRSAPESSSDAVETTTTEPAPATTTTELEVPPFEVAPIEWTACGSGECGELVVPLHHDDPTGATIEISMSRIPATGDPIGSLFLNFGGPGGEGTDTLFRFGPLISSSIREHFHVVSWDPRGVDETEGLGCDHTLDEAEPVLIDPEDGFADDVEQETIVFDRLMACVVQRPVSADLGTVAVAHDLDLMRQGVGDDRLNYLGFSYGTQIGWVYATLFPSSVRSMVLDGAVPPFASDEERAVNQITAVQAAFDRYDRGCDRDEDCVLRDEGLAATIERLTAELDAEPLTLESGDRYGPTDLLGVTVALTYADPDLAGPLLADAVAALDDGDTGQIVTVEQLFSGEGDDGAFWSVLCADGAFGLDDAGLEQLIARSHEASPLFGQLPGTPTCQHYPAEVVPLPELDTSGTPPLLVVGSTGDNATPYRDAVALDGLLADSVLVTYEGPGHTIAFRDTCVDAIVDAYLVDSLMPEAGTVCTQPASSSPWYEPIPAD